MQLRAVFCRAACRLGAVVLLAGLVQGCGWPRVHKVIVQQGNVITQEMVDKIKPGMTRSQVAYVMGEPVVRNTFDDSRWDYVYTLENPGRYEVSSQMSLYFENNKLAYFTGDLAPTSAKAEPEEGDETSVADNEDFVERAIQIADEVAGGGDDINAAGAAQTLSSEADNEIKR